MAREIIDSKFFGDNRVTVLSELCQESIYTTRGRLVSLWHECYCQVAESLQKEDIDIQSGWLQTQSFAELLVKSRLATANEDGTFRLKGIEDRISWIRDRSKGGKKSAETRKLKYGSAQPQKPELIPNSPRTDSELTSNSPEPIVSVIVRDSVSVKDSVRDSVRVRDIKHTPVKRKRLRSATRPSEFDFNLTDRWITWACKEGYLSPTDVNLNQCAETIRKLRTVDKLDEDSIESLFQFVKTDDWWPTRAASPAGLRKLNKESGNRKYRSILNAMKSKLNGGKRKQPSQPGYFDDEIEAMNRKAWEDVKNGI